MLFIILPKMTAIVSEDVEREYMQIPTFIMCKSSQCLKTRGNGCSIIKRISKGLALAKEEGGPPGPIVRGRSRGTLPVLTHRGRYAAG